MTVDPVFKRPDPKAPLTPSASPSKFYLVREEGTSRYMDTPNHGQPSRS